MDDVRGAIPAIDAAEVSTVARAAGVAVVTTTAAVLTAAGGGTMTTATIGATASAHAGLKVAAGCLAATLAAGGAAAATGHLPAPAQRFAADAAAHVGITLPRPQATATIQTTSRIAVGSAGTVAVSLDAGGRLDLATIDANAGFTADVIAQTADSILIEFRSATDTTAVLVSNVDGTIVSSVTAGAGASADSSASTGADVSGGADPATNGSAGVSIEGDLQIGLGG